MRHLVLIRHGESEWNAERRIQGQAGGGLSARGHDQAARVARAVAAGWRPDRIVASDLQRAAETAAPVGTACGLDVDFDVELRERDFGRWSGVLRADAETDDPEIWRRWTEGDDVIAELGGESSTTFGDRVVMALRTLIEDTPAGATTVVVAHGGPIWHGTHHLVGAPPGVLGGVANTSIAEIGIHPTHGCWLERWNETGHLPAELRTTFRPSDTRASRLDAEADGQLAPRVGG